MATIRGFREGFIPLNQKHWRMIEEYEGKTGTKIEEIDERSAGCIVFSRNDGGELVVLLVEQSADYFNFPKGHIDPGEDDITAAIRETFEESGVFVKKEEVCVSEPVVVKYSLACKLHTNRWVLHPAYPREESRPLVIGHKTVTFFCAYISAMQHGIPQEGETLSVKWCTLDEANALLHDSVRERLSDALSTNFLKKLMTHC